MARLNYEGMCLMHFMDRDKDLWDQANDNDEYVVGVIEDAESKPMKASRHYFTNQKDAMDFLVNSQDQGKGANIEPRHPVRSWFG